MTGQEAIDYVRFLVQEAAAHEFSDENIIRALNSSLYKYASSAIIMAAEMYYSSTTITLSSGTRTASLPSDCNGHIDFMEYDSVIITHKLLSQQETPANGNPNFFDIKGNTIYFDKKPTSDISITIYYYQLPTEITSSNLTDEIDFPTAHHYLLCFEAAILLGIRDKMDVSDLRQERDRLFANFKDLMGWRIHSESNQGVDYYGKQFGGYRNE